MIHMPHNSTHFMYHVMYHLARAALLGVATAVIALALQSGPALGEDVGTVTKIRADAYGTPPAGKRERKYPRYDVVFGELIETDGGAALLITMNDDTELFLGERASLTIDEFVYEPGSKTGRAVYNFTVGTLRFVSGTMDSAEITIQTPNANIGLRGSEAILFVTPEGQTIVNVLKGTFWVRRREASDRPAVEVSANQNVSITGTAPPSPVGVGIQMPTYSHAPGPSNLNGGAFDTDKGHDGPDFSEDLRELTPGSGFDKARPGKVGGSRGDDGHDHHDDGHDGGH